jgi:hypothetical protein
VLWCLWGEWRQRCDGGGVRGERAGIGGEILSLRGFLVWKKCRGYNSGTDGLRQSSP